MKNNLNNLTITQITETFPDECRAMIPRVNRCLKSAIKPYLLHCKSIRNRYYDDFTETFLLACMRILYNPDAIEHLIRRNKIILTSLDAPQCNKITDAMIEQAKNVPIIDLYDFEKQHISQERLNACCPFHPEKVGSFFIYRGNNTFYCFSCQFGGDAIAFIKKLHEFNFPDAIKFLLKQ